jgi:alanyl aminopeptidase
MKAFGSTTRLAIFVLGCKLLGGPPAPSFRLPQDAQPKQESLDITIVPAERDFHGQATIALELKRPLEMLWLNAKELAVEEVTLETGGRTENVRWTVNDEFLGLEFGRAAGPGPATLRIRYSGKLADQSRFGIYRRKSGDDWYVYTTFTPIEARRAFPCFDEPGYKIEWRLTLRVPRSDVAVANSPAESETAESGGMKRVVFAPTAPLPSELVAFAVGPFDVVEAGRAGIRNIPVRIITPRGRGDDAAAARTATRAILGRLEEYTAIPYPWAKLDHLAAVDQAFGAVENPGLIMYREAVLLSAPERDTFERQRAMRNTMAHELAHQWFGNLVTQSWWDDVWLSEGFATWLGSKIADLDLPPFERGITAAERRHDMLLADTAAAVRPVRLAINSRDAIKDVYDGIVYQKGAAVLSMMEEWLGPDSFRSALQRYLAEHQSGNATTADLAHAIREETHTDVTAVLNDFLNRPHAPQLRFAIRCANAGGPCVLNISQSGVPWSVPVCWHANGGARACQVVAGNNAVIPLERSPAWIWTNATGVGYYRSALDGAALDAVVNKGYGELTEPERASLAGDLVGATVSGSLGAREILPLLPRIARDNEPAVAAHAATILLRFALVAPDATRSQFSEWLRSNMHILPAAPDQRRSIEDFFRDKRN